MFAVVTASVIDSGRSDCVISGSAKSLYQDNFCSALESDNNDFFPATPVAMIYAHYIVPLKVTTKAFKEYM